MSRRSRKHKVKPLEPNQEVGRHRKAKREKKFIILETSYNEGNKYETFQDAFNAISQISRGWSSMFHNTEYEILDLNLKGDRESYKAFKEIMKAINKRRKDQQIVNGFEQLERRI